METSFGHAGALSGVQLHFHLIVLAEAILNVLRLRKFGGNGFLFQLMQLPFPKSLGAKRSLLIDSCNYCLRLLLSQE